MAIRITLGLFFGAIVGAFVAPHVPWLVPYVARPMGDVFLRLLMVLVMPLAAVALILGVAELRPGAVGQLAARAMGLTLALTTAGVALGVSLVHLVQPGRGVLREALPSAGAVEPLQVAPMDAFLAMIPNNVVGAASRGELLGVLIFAVLFGVALRAEPAASTARLREVLEGLFAVLVRGVHLVMRLAPLGVAGLVCALVAKAGLEGLIPLAKFVGVVLTAILVQGVVVYGVALRLLSRHSLLSFYAGVQPALAMAFSTASSAATLPTSLQVAESGLGLRPDLARFVLTVGASANQNGTALFEGVAVLFLAQLYGVELTMAQQAFVVVVSIAAGVGTAGVPGASLPVIASIAAALGVPPESVGVLVGVDRLLDMCRTTLNVAGDLVIAACLEEQTAA